ncbi:MAG TPA: hypothetical protein VLF20_02310 [Patescibacteria group bacterium]|nr:hypothetical protein [Patescibacteria group bacterium]
MGEQPPRVEPPASPEKSVQRYMTPPRARILASVAFENQDVLNPDIPTPTFDQASLTEGLANKDRGVNFNPLALLSSESRKKRYEEDHRDFNEQYQGWEQKTQKWITWAANHKSDFREALTDLGITNTDQAAKTFYETYLENVPEGASAEERTNLTKRQSDQQIHNGLVNFSYKIREASFKDGVVDMAEVNRRLEALRPLLNAFGTADEVAERVRDYVTAQALLDQEDQGVVAKAVMERVDSTMSIEDENSMRALARHAGVSPGSASDLGREPEQRSRLAEGVAAAAGTVAGAALAERSKEDDNDEEAPVAPVEPFTQAKATEEAGTGNMPVEPEPAPQSPSSSEEENHPIDPGEEFLKNTDRVLTDDEVQVVIDYFGVPSEKRDAIRPYFESVTDANELLTINVVRELSTLLGDEKTRESLETAAREANRKIQVRLEKLDIAGKGTQDALSHGEWYFSGVAMEKFLAEHHEVKQFLGGDDIFQSVDPTAYYLKKDLAPESMADSEVADLEILYQKFGEIVLKQKGEMSKDEYAQKIVSKLADTLSGEERGRIEEILGFPASSVPPGVYEELGDIIWENLEDNETSVNDRESGRGADAQRGETVAGAGDDGSSDSTVDAVKENVDGGTEGGVREEEPALTGDEAASEVTLSGDAEETTREGVVSDEQADQVVDGESVDGASGDTEQETTNNTDVVESDTPTSTEEAEEPVRTIDVSTTDTDNDADMVNGGNEQGDVEGQEAQEDDDGTPPQTPPPPVVGP